MTTLYGFTCANHAEEPAWFHHEQSARNFSAACGFTDNPIEEIDAEEVDPADVLDTADKIWMKD